jgi:hypothetical protein
VASALKDTAKEVSLSREVHLFASAKGNATSSIASHIESPVKSDIDGLPSRKIKLNRKAHAIVIGIEQYRQ